MSRERLVALAFMIFFALTLGAGYYGMATIAMKTQDLLCATLLGVAIGFPLGFAYAEIQNSLTLKSAKQRLRNELRKLIEKGSEEKR